MLAVLCGLLAGCGQQKMAEQPAYKTFDPSDFFGDRRSARPLVADTVARGQLRDDPLLFTGRRTPRTRDGDAAALLGGGPSGALGLAALAGTESFSDEFPFPVTREVLLRGQQRYNIFCSVCHGYTGYGNGKIVERGYTKPPSYHEDRLRKAAAGYFFDVITRGYGSMPDYRAQVGPRDRWAIVAYIRALQESQSVPERELTPEDRERLPPRRGGK